MQKRTIRIGLAAVLLAAFSGPVAVAQNRATPAVPRSVRIAVVDLKRVIDNYRRSKDLDKKMEELKASLRQKVADKEQKIAKMVQARKFLKTPSPEEQSLADQIDRERVELSAMRQQGEVMVREMFRNYVMQVFADVQKSIVLTAERNGLDLVFKKEDMGLEGKTERELSLKLNMKSVLYASKRLDITDRVIRTLNTEYEREKRVEPGVSPKTNP